MVRPRMMNHLNEGLIQAYLDDEVSLRERELVEVHLAQCAVCAGKLQEQRDMAEAVSLGLGLLDVSPPAGVSPQVLRARAHASRRCGAFPGWLKPARPSLLKAAVLLLGFSAVTAAALPGSPLREWALAVWQRGAGESVPEAAAVAIPLAQDSVMGGGVSIVPAGGRVRIVLERPAPSTEIRVRLVDDERAGVQALKGLSDAVFKTGSGRIEVVGGTAGTLHVEIPRSVVYASVEVDGVVEVFKEGPALRVVAPDRGEVGQEVIVVVEPR